MCQKKSGGKGKLQQTVAVTRFSLHPRQLRTVLVSCVARFIELCFSIFLFFCFA